MATKPKKINGSVNVLAEALRNVLVEAIETTENKMLAHITDENKKLKSDLIKQINTKAQNTQIQLTRLDKRVGRLDDKVGIVNDRLGKLEKRLVS